MAINDDVTITLLSKALDAGHLQQLAIANNVANNNVIGYQPQTVNFSQQLDQLQKLIANNASDSDLQRAAENLKPSLINDPNQAVVHLDSEMLAEAKNATQYQALTKGLQQQFAIYDLAINGGKQ